MKRVQFGIAALVIAVLGMIVPGQNRVFRGEIMDSYCAEVGSHETITTSAKSAKDCTISCVQVGAKYVLYSPSRNKSYRLDDQRAPKIFAGEKVRIIGTYDSATNTIHVMDIEPTLLESLKQFASVVRAHFSRS